jgi:TolC family type I secretion outer membrane protein
MKPVARAITPLAWASVWVLCGGMLATGSPAQTVPRWGDPIRPAAPAESTIQAAPATRAAQAVSAAPLSAASAASAWRQGDVGSPRQRMIRLQGLVMATELRVDAEPSAAAGPAVSGSAAASSATPRKAKLGELHDLLEVPQTLAVAGAASPEAGLNALNLEQAMDLAVLHSLDVRANAARSESFAQTALAARGVLLPRLDARLAEGKGQLESVNPNVTLPRKEGSITLHQALFDAPGYIEYRRQGVLASSVDLQWEAAISNVSVEAASAYLQALQLSLSLELSREYESLLGELLTYISDRAAAGGTSTAERDRVKARVANVRSQLADTRANLRASLRNLQSLIGQVPQGMNLNVPGGLGIPAIVAEAQAEARHNNRDLVAARTEVDAADWEAKGMRAKVLPRVDLELSHNRAVNSAGSASYLRDTKAMLVVNWSLLNGGSDLAQQRAALARQQEKKLRAEDTERKLDQELDAAYVALDAVGERFAALREELAANRAVVTAFKAQLVGGNRPLLDVLDAYQRLHQTRLDVVQVAIGETQNHVKVAHLTGRLAAARAASAQL